MVYDPRPTPHVRPHRPARRPRPRAGERAHVRRLDRAHLSRPAALRTVHGGLDQPRRRHGVRPIHLVLPLTSATCFGVVAVLRKIGLSGMAPIPGFAVNVTAALVAYTAFLVASRQSALMVCRGRSLVYFAAAGVAENVGVCLVVLALSVGTVSVVAPLASVSPIFVLVLSFFFLRGIELLNRRIVVGTLLIVSGVYLLTALR